MSYRGFLAELLLAECDDRARRRSERRIKAAKFPREKSLRAFDFDANPNIDPAVIHTLAKCEWVQNGQPLCLIGDSAPARRSRSLRLLSLLRRVSPSTNDIAYGSNSTVDGSNPPSGSASSADAGWATTRYPNPCRLSNSSGG